MFGAPARMYEPLLAPIAGADPAGWYAIGTLETTADGGMGGPAIVPLPVAPPPPVATTDGVKRM